MKKQVLYGRPYYLEGGDAGVLLLHGFTGTPQAMRYLSRELHQAKFTVSVPVIKGHGTHVEDLEQTEWQDWYRSAEAAFHELKSQCKVVMVAGLSMGGLLAARLAHHHPGTIKALGLMATPLFLDSFLIDMVFPTIWKTPLKKFYKYQTKYQPAIKDPGARRRYQAYSKIPVASVAALLELQKKVRPELKHIRQPSMIIHSLYDETVPYGNVDYIKATLASKEIKTVTLKKSNHIITVDYEKDVVAKQLIRFFKKYR